MNSDGDEDFHRAQEVISELRLNMGEGERTELARFLAGHKRLIQEGIDRIRNRPNKAEEIGKVKQIADALNKAQRLLSELSRDKFDLSDIPPCSISDVSLGRIEFARDENDKRITDSATARDEHCEDLWWIQILGQFEIWMRTRLSDTQESPPLNESAIKQRGILLTAIHCWRKGIRISDAENSQFYKIVKCLLPDIKDLRHRIGNVKSSKEFLQVKARLPLPESHPQ